MTPEVKDSSVKETHNIDPTNCDLENPTGEMAGREYKIIPTSIAENGGSAPVGLKMCSDQVVVKVARVLAPIFLVAGGIMYGVCQGSSSDKCSKVINIERASETFIAIGGFLTFITWGLWCAAAVTMKMRKSK